MIVDQTKRRLNAIKLRFKFFATKCDSCNKLFKMEKMWQFSRDTGVNDENINYHYCQNCMKSKEDVLYEIDTDESPYGIAGIDEDFEKKDSTRMDAYIARVSRRIHT